MLTESLAMFLDQIPQNVLCQEYFLWLGPRDSFILSAYCIMLRKHFGKANWTWEEIHKYFTQQMLVCLRCASLKAVLLQPVLGLHETDIPGTLCFINEEPEALRCKTITLARMIQWYTDVTQIQSLWAPKDLTLFSSCKSHFSCLFYIHDGSWTYFCIWSVQHILEIIGDTDYNNFFLNQKRGHFTFL